MLNNAKQILVSELVLAEHASENEVENLKHIIEGLRYGEEAEKIAQLLIY